MQPEQIQIPQIESIDQNNDQTIDKNEFQQTADKIQLHLNNAQDISRKLNDGAGLGFAHQKAINELFSTIEQLKNMNEYSGAIAPIKQQINRQIQSVFTPVQRALAEQNNVHHAVIGDSPSNVFNQGSRATTNIGRETFGQKQSEGINQRAGLTPLQRARQIRQHVSNNPW